MQTIELHFAWCLVCDRWCEAHRAVACAAPIHLDYHLLRLQYLHLLSAASIGDALVFARTHFPAHMPSHSHGTHCMDCMAIVLGWLLVTPVSCLCLCFCLCLCNSSLQI